MNLIKKIFVVLSVLLTVCTLNAVAKNNVSEIDINVTVRDDGSAYVVQDWRGNFVEGTENYIPINTNGIGIMDFKVSDINGQYTFVENWDVDKSFSEKAGKCGVVETADGVELCFGITRYGENRYAIEYVITDFIKSYTDYDGTNFMFVNPGMSTFPTDVHINITLANGTVLDENNAQIWAFGFDGYIEFYNGSVNAWSTQALDGNDSAIVMFALEKGLIFPETSVYESFETVKDTAFEGSDYEDDVSILEVIFMYIVIFAVLAVVLMIAIYLIKRKKAIKKFYKEADYFRNTPNDGKMEVSYYLSRNFDVSDDDSLIIGALMLSMMNKKSLEPIVEDKTGMFGKVKQTVNVKLLKVPDTDSEYELYRILVAAAGEDGILQEKELEKYSYKNPDEITDFMDKVKKAGEAEVISSGGFVKGAGNCIKDLSYRGKEELAQVMGLKKYLDEFTLLSEREITELEIWKEYMVYATLFGIADKVVSQLEKVYPEKFKELEDYNRDRMVTYSYYRSMHRSTQKAIQQRRASGGGGRSSLGGGGGFSGGGRGGGSR